MKRFISIILLAALLTSVACGDSGSTSDDSTSAPSDGDTTVGEDEFVYEYKNNYNGEEFTILNAGDVYNMRAELDRETTTGEPLDDAMFERCRLVEEKLGITLVEVTKHIDSELAQFASQAILSGEDEYDIMYIPAQDLNKFTSQNQLYNLLDYDELQLDKPWWSQSYNDAVTMNGELYSAVGSSQLMYIDSLWAVMFNEDMVNDLGMDMPYDLVREGKWTFDAMAEYLKAGVRLNGDESFAWNEHGNCIYGISGTSTSRFLASCGEFFIEQKNGKLEFTADSESLYAVAEALPTILNTSNGNCFQTIAGVVDGAPGNYITTFEVERALFLGAEISKTSRMRDKDFAFGLLPYPKYDENADGYYSLPFYGTPGLAIPVTCQTPDRSAVVGDALAYEGNRTVLPIFREVTLESKGLRNDDSIEMLDLIIKSSRPDLPVIYNIASDLRSNVASAILTGASISSLIAAQKSSIEAELAKING